MAWIPSRSLGLCDVALLPQELCRLLTAQPIPRDQGDLKTIANAHREQVPLRLVEAAMHGQSRPIKPRDVPAQLRDLGAAWEVAAATKPAAEAKVSAERCRAAAALLLRLDTASRPYLRVEGARLARAWLDHGGIADGPEAKAIAAVLDGAPAADPKALSGLVTASGAAQAEVRVRIDEFRRFLAGPRYLLVQRDLQQCEAQAGLGPH